MFMLCRIYPSDIQKSPTLLRSLLSWRAFETRVFCYTLLYTLNCKFLPNQTRPTCLWSRLLLNYIPQHDQSNVCEIKILSNDILQNLWAIIPAIWSLGRDHWSLISLVKFNSMCSLFTVNFSWLISVDFSIQTVNK